MRVEADILWQQNGAKARAQLSIEDGITALIGPSGAGKTTVARMLAGLEAPTGGYVRTREQVLFHAQKRVNIPASQREIALVAQETALFPHLNVAKNIAFAPTSTPESVFEAASALGCDRLMDRVPETLSGGEKRRVAIARALAAKPKLLILDEPMTGLDPKSRGEILPYIAHLAKMDDLPVLLITHQLEDMLSVADNAVLIAPGKTLMQGSLEDVVRAPACSELLGLSDAGQLITGTALSYREGMLHVAMHGGGATLSVVGPEPPKEQTSVILRIFASDIALARSKVPDISVHNQFEGKITRIEQSGAQSRVHVQIEDSDVVLESLVTSHTVQRLKLHVGEPIVALIKAVSVKNCASTP